MYGRLFADVALIRKPQANVLIDDSGNPRLTGFNLATVVGDPELQLTMTTVDHSFDIRWRAPELIGVDCDPEMPTFESDLYSFGSVMFFVRSLVFPWRYIKFSLPRSSREISHGKRRSISIKSALSCLEESLLHVLRTSSMIYGT
jgi:serine/threonine protein kinase